MARCEDLTGLGSCDIVTKMNQLHAAYMAGIIDGEGCVYVNRRNPTGRRLTPGYGAKVCVTTTDQVLVNYMKENANLTSIHWKQPPGNRKPCWLCTWNNSFAEGLLLSVLPFLIIKKPQAELALTLMKHLREIKSGGVGKMVYPHHIAFREEIKQQISNLNQRGKIKS